MVPRHRFPEKHSSLRFLHTSDITSARPFNIGALTQTHGVQRLPIGFACLILGAAFTALAFGPGAALAFSCCSLSAASFAAARSSVFWAFFCLMSSSDIPTIAFWTFVLFFVRFLPASSALPFLFFR